MDKKIWYIDISGVDEGPYSIAEMLQDKRITFNTLVWREGFNSWTSISNVEELKKYFGDSSGAPEKDIPENPEKDTPENNKGESQASRAIPGSTAQEELALIFQREPPYLLFWIIAIILLSIYYIIRLFND